LDPIALRLPKDTPRRFLAVMGAAATLIAIENFVLSFFPEGDSIASLWPMLAAIGSPLWFALYPALSTWRERADLARPVDATTPDFDAKRSAFEVPVAVIAAVASLIWIRLGHHASGGVLETSLTMAHVAFTLGVMGCAAILFHRPDALHRLRLFVLKQSFGAGIALLEKGNGRRARRFLERALEAAQGTRHHARVLATLQTALRIEADELRHKGRSELAEDLLRREKRIGPSSSPSVSSEPRLLRAEEIGIEGKNAIEVQPLPAEKAQIKEQAAQLERSGRPREALELLVQHGLGVSRAVAQEAAKDYTAKGHLRSAFAIYEALDEHKQLPQFYEGVAAEWSKETGSTPPADVCLKLSRILLDFGFEEPAARLACHGAASKIGSDKARREAQSTAILLCNRIGMEPPPEVLEAMGEHSAAGDVYEQEGRKEDALRAYARAADEAERSLELRPRLIPILCRMFLLHENLEDRHLTPLALHALEGGGSSTLALRILLAYRARGKDDPRIADRLVGLYSNLGKKEEAFTELLTVKETLDKERFVAASKVFLDHFDHEQARLLYARALIERAELVAAADQVRRLLEIPSVDRVELITLLELLVDWGHSDIELIKSMGLLRIEAGRQDLGLLDLARYAKRGGRDPVALEILERNLGALPTPEAPIAVQTRSDLGLDLADAHLSLPSPQSAPVEYVIPVHDETWPTELSASALKLADPGISSDPSIPIEWSDGTIRETGLHFEIGEDTVRPKPQIARPIRLSPPAIPVKPGEDPGSTDLVVALLPRYRLIRTIGAGGMGEVHLAEDLELGRGVAMKVLKRSLATDLFISKFREEARIVARLSHPGIVSIYDLGQEGQWSYIVMEYVDGPNLTRLINESGGFTRRRLLTIAASVADAMEYAHSRGVIHRDLKPANILVGPGDVAKVTDFGIAKVLENGDQTTAFSAAGMRVGTINFMAPEQIGGGPIDGRTDVYLLGTTLYLCLAGSFPFDGDDIAERKLFEDAPSIRSRVSNISLELEELIMRCLARRPADRFPSMAELAAALRAVVEARSDSAPQSMRVS
jgi:tetratricopeptide (TPR) repeat protein